MLEVGKRTKEVLPSKRGMSADTAPVVSGRPLRRSIEEDRGRPDFEARTNSFP